MRDDADNLEALFIHRTAQWEIFNENGEVVAHVTLPDDALIFLQDVASLLCDLKKQPLWVITAKGQAQKIVRVRQYLIFMLRFHPSSLGLWKHSGEGWGASFPKLGAVVNRDHTTVQSALRRLFALSERSRYRSGIVSDLQWVADMLRIIDRDRYAEFVVKEKLPPLLPFPRKELRADSDHDTDRL